MASWTALIFSSPSATSPSLPVLCPLFLVLFVFLILPWQEEISGLSLPEQYIVSLCHQLVNDVSKQLDEYVLGQVRRSGSDKSGRREKGAVAA
eukprot:768809-Hanusia_phi.AAC.2